MAHGILNAPLMISLKDLILDWGGASNLQIYRLLWVTINLGILGDQGMEPLIILEVKFILLCNRKGLMHDDKFWGVMNYKIYLFEKIYRIFPCIRRPLDKTRYKIRANFYEFILYR